MGMMCYGEGKKLRLKQRICRGVIKERVIIEAERETPSACSFFFALRPSPKVG